MIEITFDVIEKIWNGEYQYNVRRFGNLLKCFTEVLWKRMCMMVPKVSPEYRSSLIFVESTMKFWVNRFEECRMLNERNKRFPTTEKWEGYMDRIEEVKKVLILLDEIAVINRKINLELNIKEISEIFENVIPLSMNEVLRRNWEKGKRKFDLILQSKSLLIAVFFKEKIVSVGTAKKKPLKVLQNMIKWSTLLELPEIDKKLSREKS